MAFQPPYAAEGLLTSGALLFCLSSISCGTLPAYGLNSVSFRGVTLSVVVVEGAGGSVGVYTGDKLEEGILS